MKIRNGLFVLVWMAAACGGASPAKKVADLSSLPGDGDMSLAVADFAGVVQDFAGVAQDFSSAAPDLSQAAPSCIALGQQDCTGFPGSCCTDDSHPAVACNHNDNNMGLTLCCVNAGQACTMSSDCCNHSSYICCPGANTCGFSTDGTTCV